MKRQNEKMQDCVLADCGEITADEVLHTIGILEDNSLRIMAIMGIIGKLQRARADREMEKVGMTSAQVEVMLYLMTNEADKREITAKELEQQFRVSNPTMSGILKRLEKKGMIERTCCLKDKRNKQIRLKADVISLREMMVTRLIEEKELLFRNFTEAELVQMSQLLTKLLHNLEQDRNEE